MNQSDKIEEKNHRSQQPGNSDQTGSRFSLLLIRQ